MVVKYPCIVLHLQAMDIKQVQEAREQIKRRLGERVKKAREAAGHSSQESLAAAIGVSRQAISAIESGLSVPASDTLFLIAQETRQTLEFFFPPFSGKTGSCDRIEQKLDRVLSILEEQPRLKGTALGGQR